MSGPRWTVQETDLLRSLWYKVEASELASRLPERRWANIRNKAYKLGLPFGAPQGHESVVQAVARTGYSESALRRMLDRQRVSFRHYYPRPGQDPKRAVCRYYAIKDVNEAVGKHMRGETLKAASDRLMCSSSVLRELLKRHRLRDAEHYRRHARIVPEVYDSIVCRWRKGEYQRRSDAARRSMLIRLGRLGPGDAKKLARQPRSREFSDCHPWALRAWAIREHGSFTAAAARLGVYVTTLSDYMEGRLRIPAWVAKHVDDLSVPASKPALNHMGRKRGAVAMGASEFRQARISLRMRSIDLSVALGVTKSCVSFYESGKRPVLENIAAKMLALLSEQMEARKSA